MTTLENRWAKQIRHYHVSADADLIENGPQVGLEAPPLIWGN